MLEPDGLTVDPRQPISVKGPDFTQGSLESKYEVLGEIGALAELSTSEGPWD